MKLNNVNHIAVIASDIERSIALYVDGGMTKQMIYHAEHGWTMNE